MLVGRRWSKLTHWRRGKILMSFYSTWNAVFRIKVTWIRRCYTRNFLSIIVPDVGSLMRQMTAAVTLELWPWFWAAHVHLETWISKETQLSTYTHHIDSQRFTVVFLNVEHLELTHTHSFQQTLPVTDRVTPGEPVYFSSGWFVINLNLYSAESLSLRSVIVRVQMLRSQRYSTRPAYSDCVLRSTGSLSCKLVNQKVSSTVI